MTIDVPCSIQLDGWTSIRESTLCLLLQDIRGSSKIYPKREGRQLHHPGSRVVECKTLCHHQQAGINREDVLFYNKRQGTCKLFSSDRAQQQSTTKDTHHSVDAIVSTCSLEAMQESRVMDKCRDWKRSGWAQKRWGMYQVEKCTPTRWHSLGEHPRVCLLMLHFQSKTSVFSRNPKSTRILPHSPAQARAGRCHSCHST